MVGVEVGLTLAAMDYRVSSYRAIIASTTAILNTNHRHQNGWQVPQDDDSVHLQALDHRLDLASELLQTEREYLTLLQSVLDIYAEPFRKLTSLPQEHHRILFVGLEPIVSLSAMVASKLDDATQNWDPASTKIGNLFSSKFWSHYDDYAEGFCAIEGLLGEKYETDESFVEFLELRQGKSELSLEDLLRLPVQRIPEYDKYLNELLQETDPGHPDYDHLSRAAAKVRHMVKEREDELGNMDNQKRIERVQDKFPYDDLQLRDLDQQRRQLASRRKSAPGAVLFKTLGKSKSANNLLTQSMGKKDMDFLRPIRQHNNFNRQYLMEGNVEFSRGMQTQDRYLFLFSDLLLVAKQKSNTTFKLKHRIRVSEVWIAFCIDDVTELTRPPERSFVIGWPTTNVVATFKSEDLKETWLNKLKEQIEDERGKLQPKLLHLEVHYKESNKECQLDVETTTEANTIVKNCLEQLELPEKDLNDYQLWARLGPDESPYPLCGHELPYAIKVSHLRDFAKRTEDNLTEIEIQRIMTEMQNNNRKYEFFLKHKKSQKRQSLEETSAKPAKGKKGKSPLINLFRGKNRDDKKPQGQLFGHSLANVTTADNLIAKPVRELLTILFREGPYTVGILRKSCNAKALRELRQKLDDGEDCLSDENLQPLVIGSLVKDYLRNIPQSLLMEDLFTDWLAVNEITDPQKKVNAFREIINKLPAPHEELLRHVVCVLYHIDKKCDINKMTAYNLSVCIAPSVLWPKGSNPDPLATPPSIIQYLIENCVQVFGETSVQLFGDPAEHKLRQDSSTDSDSMHSVLSNHSNFRRDDSSIDSLEREIYSEGIDSSPHITKSHHFSPSNLSGDSGLTLSDSQLYDEDGNGNEIGPDRRYGRSASHCIDRDLAQEDGGQASHSLDNQYFYEFDPQNPVPPPRRLKKKGNDQNQSPNMEYDRKPLKFTSQTNFQMSGRNERRYPQSVHSNNDKYKRSLESLKSVEEGSEGESNSYIKGYPRNKDYGTLVKSASGAHLFYDDFSQFEFSDDFDNVNRSNRRGRLYKQSSDGAMPMSPQSKYSLSSSRDSVLSDSSGSFFNRQNSPDRLSSSADTPDMEEQSMSHWLAQQSNETHYMNMRQRQFSHDDSEVGLKLDKKPSNKMEYLVSPKSSPKLKRREPLPLCGRRSFPLQGDLTPRGSGSNTSKEAEDIIRSPKLTITYCSQDSLDKRGFDMPQQSVQSPQLDIYNNNSQLALKQLNMYSTGLQGTSPPPRVVLQGLNQNGTREKRENTPLKGNHNIFPQERRKSFDMGEIRERKRYPMEESSVSSEEEGAESEPEIETYRVMTMVNVPLKYEVSQKMPETPPKESDSVLRPEQPPAYNEAIQRNFMIKQGLSPDKGIDEAAVQRQREANMKAKQLYEQSMKQYQEQRERSAFSLPSQQFEQKLDVVGEKQEEHVNSEVEDEEIEEEVETLSSDEDLPEHNPRKLYEESLKRYMEEQSSQVKPPLVKTSSHDEELSISKPRGGGLKQNLKKLANIYRSQSDAQDFTLGRLGRGSVSRSNPSTETTPTKRPVQPPPYNNPPPYHSDRSDSSPSSVERHRFPVAKEMFYLTAAEKSVGSSSDVPRTVSQHRSSVNAQNHIGAKGRDNVGTSNRASSLPRNQDPVDSESKDTNIQVDQSVRSAQNELLNVSSPIQKVHNRDNVFRPRASSLEQRPQVTVPTASAQGPIVYRNPAVSKSQVIIRANDQTARRNSLDAAVSKSAIGVTRELPWSVKRLSNIFDQSSSSEVQTKPSQQSQQVSPAASTTVSSTSSSSPSRPSVPPPYTPPPPFHQRSDNIRSSNSSTSSRSSAGTARKSFSKLGPQARDSFSSTDDSDCSCRYSLNCRRDNSSFEELDNLSFTDITYV